MCSPFGPEILDIEITTICSGIGNYGPCKFCSPAGTLINTVHGSKPIEEIKSGDYVIGYDLTKENIKVQHVEETYKREYNGELICVELDNGSVFKLTPDHVIILKGGKEIKALELKETDEIIIF